MPRVAHDSAGQASLIIGDDGFRKVIGHIFDVERGLELAAILRDIVIVKIGAYIHPAPIPRQKRVVEVKPIGVVLIDEIASAVVEVLHMGGS